MTVHGCYSLQIKAVVWFDIRQDKVPEAKKWSEAEKGGLNSGLFNWFVFTKIHLVDQEAVHIPLDVWAWTFLYLLVWQVESETSALL